MLRADRSDNLSGVDAIAASPGFTWGKSGNVPSGTYLLNDNVPSNLSGRIVTVTDGYIVKIGVVAQGSDTFTISIERNDAGVYTELATLGVVSDRKGSGTYLVALNLDDELCCRVKSGAPKNPVVYAVIKGDSE